MEGAAWLCTPALLAHPYAAFTGMPSACDKLSAVHETEASIMMRRRLARTGSWSHRFFRQFVRKFHSHSHSAQIPTLAASPSLGRVCRSERTFPILGGVWKGAANLLDVTANENRAEVPAMQDAASYDVISSSSAGSGTLRFTVSSSKQALYIAARISSVRKPVWM